MNVYLNKWVSEQMSKWLEFNMGFFCVWSLSSHSRIFHSRGDVTIADKGLQILIYSRHSWQLSSEGSSTCHSYCDTGLPFIMVISENPWQSILLPSVWQWSCDYLILLLRSVGTGDRTQISRMRDERLPLRHRGGEYIINSDCNPLTFSPI